MSEEDKEEEVEPLEVKHTGKKKGTVTRVLLGRGKENNDESVKKE